jgi:transposase InsO family protein
VKVARTVLRGRDGGNVILLPDYLKDGRTPREAMQGLAKFFQVYNTQRPQQALGYQTPATVYFDSYS